MNFDLLKHTILLVVGGSRAYVMSRPESDVDVKGVAVAPKEYYLGYLNNFEQADKASHMMKYYSHLTDEEKSKADEGELEGSVYDVIKFVKLAANANPNILDVLFCRDSEIRLITPLGKKLRDNRYLFLSKKARFTHEGYAYSQMSKINSHRRWLFNPPTKAPERSEFGLPDRKLIPGDQLQAAINSINKKMDEWEIDFSNMEHASKIYVKKQLENYMLDLKIGADDKFDIAAQVVGCSDNFIHLMKKEREYRTAKQHWTQYNDWKKNRNPERARMEKQSGFDLKHATHLVRLYKCCREILETGTLNTYRDDAEQLLEIRNGAWTYEQVMEFVDKESKEIAELYKTSTLKKEPDRKKIDQLCVEIIEEFHGR
jgi:predicted nucleotidyltransferase